METTDTLAAHTDDQQQRNVSGTILDEHGHTISVTKPTKQVKRGIFKSKWLNVVLTGIIALATIVQVIVAYLNNAATGKQVDALIAGTRENAQSSSESAAAAQQFAASADEIGREMHNAVKSLEEQSDSVDKAREASSKASRDALQATIDNFRAEQRPWVKIKHRILSPLTFGDSSGPAAAITIEDTLENAGSSVALKVGHWEAVIPMETDYRHLDRTAVSTAKQFCEQHRHPNPQWLQGQSLFPHDPATELSHLTVAKSDLDRFTIRNKNDGPVGEIAFIVIGCVWYRSSFDAKESPTHQTRFMYQLGSPLLQGGWMSYVLPTGVADGLQLIPIPNGYTID